MLEAVQGQSVNNNCIGHRGSPPHLHLHPIDVHFCPKCQTRAHTPVCTVKTGPVQRIKENTEQQSQHSLTYVFCAVCMVDSIFGTKTLLQSGQQFGIRHNDGAHFPPPAQAPRHLHNLQALDSYLRHQLQAPASRQNQRDRYDLFWEGQGGCSSRNIGGSNVLQFSCPSTCWWYVLSSHVGKRKQWGMCS